MTELMIDIETLDVGQRSVILSIGILPFSDETGSHGEGILLRPSVQEQLDLGRTVSLSTIKFWASGQDQAAVEEAMAPDSERYEVFSTVHKFADIFSQYGSATPLWANGDIFDIGNLSSLIREVHGDQAPLPWVYNAPRDLRTFLSEVKMLGWIAPDIKIDHTALGDCRAQVEMLLSARRFLREHRDPIL